MNFVRKEKLRPEPTRELKFRVLKICILNTG